MASNLLRGDIYDVDWNPARGSEQAGIRPALVIQTDVANGVTAYPVTVILAISSKLKGYPAMVRIEPTTENGLTLPSEINTAQILTVDKTRLKTYRGFLSAADMRAVEKKLSYMLGLSP